MRPIVPPSPCSAAFLLFPAAPSWGQWFWGANFDYGFYGPYAGYSAIWAYPVGIEQRAVAVLLADFQYPGGQPPDSNAGAEPLRPRAAGRDPVRTCPSRADTSSTCSIVDDRRVRDGMAIVRNSH